MSLSVIKHSLKNIVQTSGVYKYFDESDNILYIGKAANLRKRIASYTKIDKLSSRISKMVEQIARIETIDTQTELEALLLEHNLIKQFKPKYNILLKDDKSFAQIFISKNHDFPRITKHRGNRRETGLYFGPFASTFDVNKTIDILRKTFLLRNCSDTEFKNRKKPCLEYQIKKCSAPCVDYISKEEYQKSVNQSLDFLNGKSAKIQEELAAKMHKLSLEMQFEKAANIRDKIKSLSSIQSSQNINISSLENSDLAIIKQKEDQLIILLAFYRGGNNYGNKSYFYKAKDDDLQQFLSDFLGQFYLEQTPPQNILTNIAIKQTDLLANYLSQIANYKVTISTPQRGEKHKILQNYEEMAAKNLEQHIVQNLSNKEIFKRLKEVFNLSQIPQKIEVYDNSHISGNYAIGAMICADFEGFVKNNYRKFNLELEKFKQKDDTAMLKEVLRRRFKRLIDENSPKPDLVIIDGGKGQLSAAAEIFNELKIEQKFVCISKGEDRNAGKEFFHQVGREAFTLAKNDPLMFYLQRLRDEAHRFAITSHKNRRAKSITKSALDEISGIGSKRKKDLLNYFGSTEKIKSAAIEDLMRIEGISKKIAEKIKDSLS